MTEPRLGAMKLIGVTARVAMGTARFFFLLLGALVFALVLMIAWWVSRHVPTLSSGKPAISWAVEPLAASGARPLIATHPIRGREEGWQFGSPGTGKAFAALILAEPGETARPFTLATPVFWQFEPLRVLSPRVTGPHYEMTTRWGRFTGRDLIYTENDGRARLCIVFRNAFETGDFALGGFYCAAGSQSADAGPLACLIDRLSLEPAERTSRALTYLAARAGAAPQCANSTFYAPGTRRVVRDRSGGTIGMTEGRPDSYSLWSR